MREPLTESNEGLDKGYQVSRNLDFKWGKVFKVLWSEPHGAEGVTSTVTKNNGGFPEIRRFVIVAADKGHCSCLPVLTDTGRRILKKCVHNEDHALIYTSTPPRDDRTHEEMLMIKSNDLKNDPRFVDPSYKPISSDIASRTTYAKSYTVEHNVKVQFIGDLNIGYHAEDTSRSISRNNPRKDSDLEPEGTTRYGNGKMCENCGGLLYSDEEDPQLRPFRMFKYSPDKLGAANLVSALAMGGTFIWLNNTMHLNVSSSAMGWIIDKATAHIPALLQHLPNAPDWAILTLFAASTVLFTGTTFLWADNGLQKPVVKALASLVAAIGMVSCILAGFGAEEIVLAGLPLSVSIGIIVSCLLGNMAGKEDTFGDEKSGAVLDV